MTVWAGAIALAGALTAQAAIVQGAAATSAGVTLAGALPASNAAPRRLPTAPGQSAQHDYEDQVAISPDQAIWVTASVPPIGFFVPGDDTRDGGLVSGADVWVSRDEGRTYRWVASPFNVDRQPGLAGEDSDISVAPEANSDGTFTVAEVSLYIGSSQLAWSTDNGSSWKTTPVAGVTPGQDRPWVNSDGPCTLYITSRSIVTSQPALESFDACSGRPTGFSLVLPPSDTADTTDMLVSQSNLTSKPAVDTSPRSPWRHSLYVPMTQCHTSGVTDALYYTLPRPAPATPAPYGCRSGDAVEQLLAISRDGGKTFTVEHMAHQAANRPDLTIWSGRVAVDETGAVYVVWQDGHDAWLQISRDGGQHFTDPRRLNVGLGSAAYPSVAAVGRGLVAIGVYVADRAGDVNDTKAFGEPYGKSPASWRLWVLRSVDGGRTFARAPETGVIHRGAVCTSGSSCSADDSRDLYDDFGVGILPDRTIVAATDVNKPTPATTASFNFSSATVRVPPS